MQEYNRGLQENRRERKEAYEDIKRRFTNIVAHGWVEEPSAKESRLFIVSFG